ncbi:peptidoglycan D,D-transpeptidase FtsI family protein [Propionibacterium freudenreichii]|uniref:peptidoglycan D,D-transpeptidase FtsI family protein n=1 Tax=Propionibacterium freudenreichii TaxID=1744 RepID=UPI0007AC4243
MMAGQPNKPSRGNSSGRNPSRSNPSAGTGSRRPGGARRPSGGPRPGSGQRGRQRSSGASTRESLNQALSTMRLKIGDSTKRIRIFFVVMAVAITLLAGRALVVQGINSQAVAAAAAASMKVSLDQDRVLKPVRGAFLDRNGEVLATTLPAVKVIADPYAISLNGYNADSLSANARSTLAQNTPKQIADVLVAHLGGTAADYLPQLSRVTGANGQPNRYEVMASKVPADVYQQILADMAKQTDALEDTGLNGITKEDDPQRIYPSGTLASNVLGFVNSEGSGAAGLESYANGNLAGSEGFEQYQTSQYGRIPLGNSTVKEATNGTSYQLTLDSELQYQAQQLLNSQVAKWQAVTGTTIAMNVKTGEVLAMATTPSFDSNKPGDVTDAGHLGNRAVSDAYEPGSVQKVFTMAALLDAGLISPDTKVQVPAGVQSGGSVIRDADLHSDTKYMTARGVIYNSSNVGATLLSRLMDKDTFHQYMADFGLGSTTGIEQPGESAGYLPGADMEDYTKDQMAFGQGVSVTAIQMAAGLSAVTNGGIYHEPTLIKSATDASGKNVELPARSSRRVISEDASAQLRNMMEAVVAAGPNAANTMITGYTMGAKSGTAQTINPNTGAYDSDLYMSSYVSVAPLDDPQILVYTVMQVHGQYGGTVAMPTSRDLMKIALTRYGVLPEADVPKDTDPLTYSP